jgi:solute carrier family 25 iron transporter 28/37
VLRADGPGHHPAATAVAGACATVVADAILTPLDTVKQRLQIANSPYSSMLNCASRTLRDEGWQAFYRSCAWLCPSYPRWLACVFMALCCLSVMPRCCAYAAQRCACVQGCADLGRCALCWYAACADRTTLVMNVPFTAVQFVVYESGKRALVASHLLDSTDEEGLMEQLLAGGAAGGAAAAITNPLVRAPRVRCRRGLIMLHI